MTIYIQTPDGSIQNIDMEFMPRVGDYISYTDKSGKQQCRPIVEIWHVITGRYKYGQTWLHLADDETPVK